MRLPYQKKVGENPVLSSTSGRRLGLFSGILLLMTLAAWIYPASKPDAVLGRLNYFQFWLAVILSVTAAACLTVHLIPNHLRRAVGFRFTAVLMGLVVAAIIGEIIAGLLPVHHQMDNPWYLAAGGGTSDSVELPFERPPHLKWEGMSRGDLALLSGDADPYARRITFETDMEGFRNSRDISQADLITIGDSFAEAGNVMEAESFTALAGRQLGSSARNLGRAGYTAATELIVLKKYGLKCQPKVVVWQIAEANDLAEMQIYTNWVAAGRPRYFDIKPKSARAEAWRSRSPTYKLFSLARQATPRAWPLGAMFRGQDGVEYPVRFLSMPSVEPPVRGHPAWPAFSEALLEGAVLCRTNGICLIVLLIPTKSRVLAPHSRLTDLAQAAAQRAEGDSLGVVLKEFCNAHDIEFVDATGALLEQAKAGQLGYLPYDTHLSPEGHRVVADLIQRTLAGP